MAFHPWKLIYRWENRPKYHTRGIPSVIDCDWLEKDEGKHGCKGFVWEIDGEGKFKFSL